MKKTSPELAARGNPFKQLTNHNMRLAGSQQTGARLYEAASFGVLDPDRLMQYGLAVTMDAVPGSQRSIGHRVYRWAAPPGKEQKAGNVEGVLVARKYINRMAGLNPGEHKVQRLVALLGPASNLGRLAFRVDTTELSTAGLQEARVGLWAVRGASGRSGQEAAPAFDKLEVVTYGAAELALLGEGRVAELSERLIPEAIVPLVDNCNALLEGVGIVEGATGRDIADTWTF